MPSLRRAIGLAAIFSVLGVAALSSCGGSGDPIDFGAVPKDDEPDAGAGGSGSGKSDANVDAPDP